MPFQHTAEDSGLPNNVVTAFRSAIIITMSTAPVSTPTRVRLEDNASDDSTTCRCIKRYTEGKRKVVEASSDSKDEGVQVKLESKDEEDAQIRRKKGPKNTCSSSPLPPSSDVPSLSSTGSFEHDLEPSYTFSELNPELTSSTWIGHHRVTQRVTVNRIEYLNGLPSIFPIPKTPTAFVINLHDPAFEILDERTGQFYALDALIENKDNDSWRANSGKRAPAVWVTFGPGEKPIPCRRARLGCTGIYVCERVDRRLLEVERRNLDTASRDRFLAAQSPTCNAIVHPTTGLKQRTCAHTHIINGISASSGVVNRECPATRTIFVPVDPSIRKAVVVHPQNIAHNHPIPPLKNIAAAISSNTAEATLKNPLSRKRQADEVDLHVITTARARKAPKRADADL
ncbi:hypothetical protein R3P38DRAFT_3295002 [Favolaschia claudopus]|uniref:Uncharacterized protein n=1 Tax=Favolaschia claudopus TaxID=2862362 RepID=A0AAV9ZBV5_9AGAR